MEILVDLAWKESITHLEVDKETYQIGNLPEKITSPDGSELRLLEWKEGVEIDPKELEKYREFVVVGVIWENTSDLKHTAEAIHFGKKVPQNWLEAVQENGEFVWRERTKTGAEARLFEPTFVVDRIEAGFKEPVTILDKMKKNEGLVLGICSRTAEEAEEIHKADGRKSINNSKATEFSTIPSVKLDWRTGLKVSGIYVSKD